METRRAFLKSATAMGLAGAAAVSATTVGEEAHASVPAVGAPPRPGPVEGGVADRDYWLDVTERIASPVLDRLARRELRRRMPCEAANPAERARYTHLEAFGRLLAGIAPWLTGAGVDDSERRRRKRLVDLVQRSLDAATDPRSPDFMNFDQGGQPLVDAAFLAQGILRAPSVLWEPLETRVRRHIVEALRSSRAIPTATDSNWVLFPAVVETALRMMGEEPVPERLGDCVRRMIDWYVGDGAYGDGRFFHFDYYNSFVIHPMLVDVLASLRRDDAEFEPLYALELQRARRYAEVQERLIAPDGTFPSLGRSTTYRFGAFQALAQISLLRELPERLEPAQVRCALTAVIRRVAEAPGTFDEEGWLRIGFCGHQPSLAEPYISTGSLYLCTAALLPLGLPPADPFWSGPARPWTSQRLWAGDGLPPDHALHDAP